VSSPTSRALTKALVFANAASSAGAWARIQGVQNSDIIVTLRSQLATPKDIHLPSNEIRSVTLTGKPRIRIWGHLCPSHANRVEAPHIVVAEWVSFANIAASSDNDVEAMAHC